jgi:hypothetical protein
MFQVFFSLFPSLFAQNKIKMRKSCPSECLASTPNYISPFNLAEIQINSMYAQIIISVYVFFFVIYKKQYLTNSLYMHNKPYSALTTTIHEH